MLCYSCEEETILDLSHLILGFIWSLVRCWLAGVKRNWDIDPEELCVDLSSELIGLDHDEVLKYDRNSLFV